MKAQFRLKVDSKIKNYQLNKATKWLINSIFVGDICLELSTNTALSNKNSIVNLDENFLFPSRSSREPEIYNIRVENCTLKLT